MALKDIIKVHHMCVFVRICVALRCDSAGVMQVLQGPRRACADCCSVLLARWSARSPAERTASRLATQRCPCCAASQVALDLSKLQEFTGRDKPTVIT